MYQCLQLRVIPQKPILVPTTSTSTSQTSPANATNLFTATTAPATTTSITTTAANDSSIASNVDVVGKRLREQQLQDRFKAAQNFIERTVGQALPSSDLHESLKDGVILCRLANRLRPGTVEQISLKNLPFVKMENISNFLNAAKQLGVQSSDLFQTVDLYEGKDMNQVQLAHVWTLHSLWQMLSSSCFNALFWSDIGVSTILTLERVVGGVARIVAKEKRPGPNPLVSSGSASSQIPKATDNGAPLTRMR
ncbi:calponin homology domain-containing protein [Lobosporangium transversale]|uniref:Calponin homology domain-containing protein n=1 Tax=Lobosporangium transversale TaxID=64571 RepID=A0A1Y2GIF1_9FUNG|nr:calponin homology domain-containing protein [Lobosporangium transversale]ORZ11761.1 calponin homology domain-containing protein [Lobosporangium transversale]|eukprot:XP_021879858.1 calponin homology domain-containing protein [Lobosporangium transversale]